MAIIQSYKGKMPRLQGRVFVAENATLIGDIELGHGSSVWFGAVLRGDVGAIRVGSGTNIQDGAVVHSTEGLSEVSIGEEVTIGHRAIVHGARIGNRVLVGMGAIVLDNAIVHDEVIIGAGSLVKAGSVLESGGLYVGSPARRVKELTPEQIDGLRDSADHYVGISRNYIDASINR